MTAVNNSGLSASTSAEAAAEEAAAVAFLTGLFSGGSQPPFSPAAPTTRVSARHAFQQVLHGYAILVDVRTPDQRRTQGVVDPQVIVHRAALADLVGLPRDQQHLPPLVLICQQGNASVRLASALARSGVVEVSDVIGGFEAWQAAGLPSADLR